MSLRTLVEKKIDNPEVFKIQLLDWAQQFRVMVFLDSNNYHQKQSSFDCVLAVDAFTSIKTDYHNAFEDLKQFITISIPYNYWMILLKHKKGSHFIFKHTICL
jgi:para-aminobenzoate synthetase component 1